MSTEELPADVCAFIFAYIPSVGHMEALVLTVEEPDGAWTVEKVASRLFVPDTKAGAVLRDLATAGLIEPADAPDTWRFGQQATLAEMAQRAVRLYRKTLVPMTAVIRSNAGPGGQLAGAFRFRKE
ncbi:MAG: hypothetical protein Q8P41_23815 [Pseudomonadota bacterium]|nr:hypothetical protein [Pseudomonadota bacterium]